MFATSHLSFAHGSTPILTDLTVTVPAGQRVALVGENGSGKSTLLALLAGVLLPDAGHVTRPAGPVGVLQQTPPWPATAIVADVLREATTWADRLMAAVTLAGEQLAQQAVDPAADDRATLPADRLSAALAAADVTGAWSAADRAAGLAGELGLDALPPAAPMGRLSGGQRGRLQLLHLFAGDPVGLLLDEPTTHLDDAAVAWLTDRLAAFPGPVVMASHDRQLVEDVATGVLDLDPLRGGPAVVPGGWSAYRTHRDRAMRAWRADRAAHRQAERRTLATAGEVRRDRRTPQPRDNDKFIPHANAQQAQATAAAKLRRTAGDLARLDAARVERPPEPLHLRADRLAASGPTGMLLSVVDVAVDGRLAAARLDVMAGSRTLVTGPNGVGKSTLLAVLDGTIPPTTGRRQRQPGVRIRRLAQDVEPADLATTPRQAYAAAAGEGAPELVGLGLLRPVDLGRPVGELSIGQRRRLALATTIAAAPHVLLLDEPTDHLSLDLVEELEAAIGRAPGAIVLASHDRWLRRRWDGAVLTLP